MKPHPKQSYHPYVLIAFHLQILPENLLTKIPASTKHDWKHKELNTLFGYDWYLQNQQVFTTLQKVAKNNKLLLINKTLLKVIALTRFIRRYQQCLKDNFSNVNTVALNHVNKISCVLGVKTTLKYLQLSYSRYLQMKRNKRCTTSVLDLCHLKHPTQLLRKEIETIKHYCTHKQFIHWPLTSVYHQLRRDNAAALAIGTFYKYVSLFKLQRIAACSRRKNHHTGIRAKAPLQLLHADTTLFKTLDNTRNYIYFIQDNFSRTILNYRVERELKSQIVFENLIEVNEQYLKPLHPEVCELITDGGSENYGPVKDWITASTNPVIKHIVAQQDVEFSNSMIEAANKQIKYRFLYHQHIPNHEALKKYVAAAVEDYNNRPHHVLNGLTPLEVLNGKTADPLLYQQQAANAKAHRIATNQKTKCCFYSF